MRESYRPVLVNPAGAKWIMSTHGPIAQCLFQKDWHVIAKNGSGVSNPNALSLFAKLERKFIARFGSSIGFENPAVRSTSSGCASADISLHVQQQCVSRSGVVAVNGCIASWMPGMNAQPRRRQCARRELESSRRN